MGYNPSVIMLQKTDKTEALPGVFSTLAAGFELTTRYLWLMVIPALLDLFLWIGPRLSFRPLIESLAAQMPTMAEGALITDPALMLETFASRLNHFTYLSVSLVGVPALMTGLTPEATPVPTAVIERSGWGEWAGYLMLFTLGGLLLTAVYYSLIAYALRRANATNGNGSPFSLGRFLRRTGRTWIRLVGLSALFMIVTLIITLPTALLAGFISLLSQAVASLVIIGALIFLIWIVMFLSYTPQSMTLNPSGFLPSILAGVRLFRANLPASLGLLFVVTLLRRLLAVILLSADSGTWVTAINLLAHAYISTALIIAMFIFYRDRYAAHLQSSLPQTATESLKH